MADLSFVMFVQDVVEHGRIWTGDDRTALFPVWLHELGIEVARYSLWRYALMRRSDPGCAMLALPLQQDPGDAPVHVRNSLRLGGC
ncbi:MAG: hypothetical protein OXF20_10060 [Gammaproteobacteria bacterium]|nr:hypothetical protein [Gammaproteobacteria bacterium]